MTTTIRIGDRYFWVVDDAFAVWLAYFVEEIRATTAIPEWLGKLTEDWAVAATITDFGMTVDPVDDERRGMLGVIADRARRNAVSAGDVPITRLKEWRLVDDLTVSDGFSRTGEVVELVRILEIAEGFAALLDGTLPPDPPEGWWFLGWGDGMTVIHRRR